MIVQSIIVADVTKYHVSTLSKPSVGCQINKHQYRNRWTDLFFVRDNGVVATEHKPQGKVPCSVMYSLCGHVLRQSPAAMWKCAGIESAGHRHSRGPVESQNHKRYHGR